MKQILFSLLILFTITSFAQTKLGLKLAPVVSTNRVTNDAQSAEKDGSAMKLSVGLIVDKPLSDTYFLSSGLIYLPKRAAFIDNAPLAFDGTPIQEEYTVQYLQIPISLKLFTNEVAPDFKVYFQVGGGAEIKVFDEPDDPSYTLINSFNPLDVSVILGTGVEYRAGISTTLFGGISYQRGLSNVIKDVTVATSEDLAVRSTIVSFDFGVKF